ncbi:hybrid sensor histidine kinase/response regulator [Criblamydia sequanensis]|uniref:histidine kinase n=1 Tax=Candidatus Criblamydia sequanensis CRIB-18 TaxID=1437425 RepID=A0A090D050_9BACT|nr:response regulator [Criblamydia sequanensis]CDR33175.1 Chemotaxis protein CheA [Criblamydia sequanensis CRIB-18]
MDVKDKEFQERLLSIFQEEASDHLKAISDGLLKLESDLKPNERDSLIEHIFREAHSLKGAARSVDLHSITEICQSLENVLSAWKQKKIDQSKTLFDVLYDTLDCIQKVLNQNTDPSDSKSLIKNLESLSENKTISFERKSSSISQDKAPLVSPITSLKTSKAEEKTIRISISKLDRLFQEGEELLILKLISGQQLIDFKQLSSSLSKSEEEIASIIQGLSHSKDDETLKILPLLEKYFEKIRQCQNKIKNLIQNSQYNDHFASAMIDTHLDDLKKILMQPISTVFDPIPRMVRDIASQLGKEIRLECRDNEIEIDRRILDEIKDPIIHIIRNAIDHGIELPEARKAEGKPSFGTIQIIASEREGNKVELKISDDGVGINIEKLKKAALDLNIISLEEANSLSPKDALALVFESGLSTSEKVTDLSGRGLGLKIVLEKIDKLGGHLDIDTHLSKGTTLIITLPLTLATFRGIHITVSNRSYIVPTHNVKRVLRLKYQDFRKAENCETLIVDETPLSYVHLSQLLNVEEDKKKGTELIYGLILNAFDKVIVLGVDGIFGEEEVLVKPLSNPCKRIKNIMAATIFENGTIVPILNPLDLIQSASKTNASSLFQQDPNDLAAPKTILLAEDSITTRLLLKNTLEASGYKVITAVNGSEAFERLKTNEIDLLLTDVEMPVMDGFTLTEILRRIEAFKHLPVILCTSKGSKEDKERGIDLGANAYLDKSSFSQELLLSTLRKFL